MEAKVNRRVDPKWRTFGRQLRHHRNQLSLRQVDVAREMGVVGSYYSAWETGTRHVDEKYVNKLDEVLKAAGRIAEEWGKLQRQTQNPLRFAELPDLEAAVTQLREFQPLVVPGLVQTPGYARAIFEDTFPGITKASADRLVEARMERQEILDREPRPLILMVITEAVLHQRVGGCGNGLLHEQRRRLLREAEAGRVRLQIVPHDTPHHYGNGGAFRLYTFADEPPVASAEYMTGEVIINDTDRYQECVTNFGLLQGEAYPEARSRQLIRELVDNA